MLNEAAVRWMNDLSAQGIFMTDAELTIRTWNQWLEAHSGRTAAEMVGRNLLDAYPDLVERGLDKYYKDVLEGQVRLLSQRLHGYLLPMMPQDDETSFTLMQQSARIAPLIEDDRVIGTITVIDDVTERIARENQLVWLLGREQAARKEAEIANRSKDEFLATVSHELRTPLNAISGWIKIMRKKDVEPELFEHGLEVVERNVRMQTKIIEDILDVSRIITGKLSLSVMPVDLAPIIGAALDAVLPAADAKEIQIRCTYDSNTILVSGDSSRLQQIVWNLVSNAIKFTPKGGKVDVQLARVESQAEIKVSDNGKGISAEFLPFVFERFRQADSSSARQHSGLGLGLAIVRHLIEMHGGTVQAASEGEGQGTTFIVRLPILVVRDVKAISLSEAKASDKGAESFIDEGEPAINNASQLSGLRALIVEDEVDAREMLGMLLVQFGAEIKASASAQEALRILEDWKPDVLVSDVGMPDEDGYSLISQIRALEPARGGLIPAIALTGYSRPEDGSKLLAAGYQVHLAKPVDLAQLVNAILSLSSRNGEEYNASAK